MTKLNSAKVKFQVSLTALLLVIIVLLGIAGFNSIDALKQKINEDHQKGDTHLPAFNRHTSEMKEYLTISSILLFIATSLLLHFIIHRFTNPFTRLKHALGKITGGDLGFRIDIPKNSKGEFAFIAKKFNEMADRLESMLAEAESNQQSLTTIVAGFGHEINNPLTGIIGSIELMEMKNPELDSYHQKKIGQIKKQSLRIKSIINQLNQLNPELDHTKFYINLNNLLEKLLKITHRKTRFTNIKFNTHLPDKKEKVVVIQGNHTALWQVFEGIMQNAVEAIMERQIPDGEIRVALEISQNNRYAVTTISDNGGGFEDIDKAFAPFYTTKKRTNKKGIGLSIAHNLIREHGGNILIRNTGKGAEIEVLLPLNKTETTNGGLNHAKNNEK